MECKQIKGKMTLVSLELDATIYYADDGPDYDEMDEPRVIGRVCIMKGLRPRDFEAVEITIDRLISLGNSNYSLDKGTYRVWCSIDCPIDKVAEVAMEDGNFFRDRLHRIEEVLYIMSKKTD